MSKEPVVWTAAIVGVVEALIPVLVLLGVVELDAEQIAGIMALVIAAATAVGAIFARSKVSPV